MMTLMISRMKERNEKPYHDSIIQALCGGDEVIDKDHD